MHRLQMPITTRGERPPFEPLAELGNDPSKGTNGGRFNSPHASCPLCGWRFAMDGAFMRLIGGLHARQPRWPQRLMAWDWCPECQAWWPSQQKVSRTVETIA